ncbi:1-acyl-sn-glycerol-3-phosphate acyltransferase [Bacteroidetes/Chlorobi group bacterium Naka2016]|nr:MAG: 1-acyl-sn-glycerol-3-phosphate acyltransferase [Bacteroidetes/Chlorobi group bacterium Naka2016]
MKSLLDLLSFPFRFFFVLLVTLIDSTLGILGMFLLGTRYFKLGHYRAWAKRLLFFSGVKVESNGIENISLDKSYVFVANHSSYFDIPSVFVAIPNNLRIMYKKELESIPIFGLYLKKSDFIAIEREEAVSARTSLSQALDLIQKDVSILIFPEGTRSHDGKLQEFKRGAMYLAIKSGKPIVPVTIVGANNILPKGKFFFKTGKVKVIIGKPLEVVINPSKSEINKLIDEIRSIISSNLSQAS